MAENASRIASVLPGKLCHWLGMGILLQFLPDINILQFNILQFRCFCCFSQLDFIIGGSAPVQFDYYN